MILFLIPVVVVVGLEAKKEKGQRVASVIVMNDFILRGFCQKCEWPIEFDQIDKKVIHKFYSVDEYDLPLNLCLDSEIIPVWFLSPKQIEIISGHRDFRDCGYRGCDKRTAYGLSLLLKENPFLVAQILKEAGEVKKE